MQPWRGGLELKPVQMVPQHWGGARHSKGQPSPQISHEMTSRHPETGKPSRHLIIPINCQILQTAQPHADLGRPARDPALWLIQPLPQPLHPSCVAAHALGVCVCAIWHFLPKAEC